MPFSQEQLNSFHAEYLRTGKARIFYINTYFALFLGLLLTVIGTSFSVWHTDKVIARKSSFITCSEFRTQAEAQEAYNDARLSGDPTQSRIYRNLDKNHDGIACNDLKR